MKTPFGNRIVGIVSDTEPLTLETLIGYLQKQVDGGTPGHTRIYVGLAAIGPRSFSSVVMPPLGIHPEGANVYNEDGELHAIEGRPERIVILGGKFEDKKSS